LAQSAKEWHTRCLTARQLTLLREFGIIFGSRFYLAGGTAIALHLGHRLSIDLDWFCTEELHSPELLAKQIQDTGLAVQITSVSKGTLHAVISGVRVSFLSYGYPLLQPAISDEPLGCRVASLQDLACMKLSALTQRGAKKDFIDIFALNRRALSISDMLDLYRKKYSMASVAHILYALSYFDDADKEKTPKMMWRTDWRKIKSELQEEVKKIARRFDYEEEMPE
jgi:predicted nucleotidyltransferase component of viral defense system